jgi:hypothetical protein
MSLTLNAGVASTMRQADLASRDAALSLEPSKPMSSLVSVSPSTRF